MGIEETPEIDEIKSITKPSKPLLTRALRVRITSSAFLTILAPGDLVWRVKVEPESLHTRSMPRNVEMANYRSGNSRLKNYHSQPVALIPI